MQALEEEFKATIAELGFENMAESTGVLADADDQLADCRERAPRTPSPKREPLVLQPHALAESRPPLSCASPLRLGPVQHTGLAPPIRPAPTMAIYNEQQAKKKRSRPNGGKQAGDKGLRYFSQKVCEKVQQKSKTTYNQVADELVHELVNAQEQCDDEKNIRRRVYDALNVLMALEIITKEKKEILWRGLPTNTEQERPLLAGDLEERQDRIEQKTQHLQELVTQQISFKNLVQRNKMRKISKAESISLPFIVVNSSTQTVIHCQMSADGREAFFDCSAPFEIHDDTEILTRMNLHRCDAAKLPSLVPPELVGFAAHYMSRPLGTWSEPWRPPAQPAEDAARRARLAAAITAAAAESPDASCSAISSPRMASAAARSVASPASKLSLGSSSPAPTLASSAVVGSKATTPAGAMDAGKAMKKESGTPIKQVVEVS